MICPSCGHVESKVIDSRSSETARVIRRRRECVSCGRRFTTYERVEQTKRLMVIKRDGSREPFTRENVLRGIQIACGKRNVSEDAKERMAEEVEEEVHHEFEREVSSRVIGALVMRKLRAVDEVAYIRFASEYLKIGTAGELECELAAMRSSGDEAAKGQDLLWEGKGEEGKEEGTEGRRDEGTK